MKSPVFQSGSDHQACTVEEHQPAHAVRVSGGDALHDPAAHRPATEVHLLQAERVEEANDNLSLVFDRIGEAGWLLALPVAEQIGQIDAIARVDQIGSQITPVFGTAP